MALGKCLIVHVYISTGFAKERMQSHSDGKTAEPQPVVSRFSGCACTFAKLLVLWLYYARPHGCLAPSQLALHCPPASFCLLALLDLFGFTGTE